MPRPPAYVLPPFIKKVFADASAKDQAFDHRLEPPKLEYLLPNELIVEQRARTEAEKLERFASVDNVAAPSAERKLTVGEIRAAFEKVTLGDLALPAKPIEFSWGILYRAQMHEKALAFHRELDAVISKAVLGESMMGRSGTPVREPGPADALQLHARALYDEAEEIEKLYGIRNPDLETRERYRKAKDMMKHHEATKTTMTSAEREALLVALDARLAQESLTTNVPSMYVRLVIEAARTLPSSELAALSGLPSSLLLTVGQCVVNEAGRALAVGEGIEATRRKLRETLAVFMRNTNNNGAVGLATRDGRALGRVSVGQFVADDGEGVVAVVGLGGSSSAPPAAKKPLGHKITVRCARQGCGHYTTAAVGELDPTEARCPHVFTFRPEHGVAGAMVCNGCELSLDLREIERACEAAKLDPARRYDRKANSMADELTRAKDEKREVLAENAALRREIERLERRAKGKR